MEFVVPLKVKYLRKDVNEEEDFEDRVVDINVQEDTVDSLLKKMGACGFVIYFGEIMRGSDRFKTFFDGREKLIVIDCGEDWQEPEVMANSSNAAHRLVHGGISITQALTALGRAVWHEGFEPFSDSAHLIKKLIDESSLEDYQDRTETVAVTDHGELETVAVFNEYSGNSIYFPPELGVDVAGQSQFVEEGRRRAPRKALGSDSQAVRRETKRKVQERTPMLEKASSAVVRMFGYHSMANTAPEMGPIDTSAAATPTVRRPSEVDISAISAIQGKVDDTLSGAASGFSVNASTSFLGPGTEKTQYRVVPFTGFFVTPTLLMATKNCDYSSEENTYAEHYAFTRRTRATYPFLTEGVDLHRCRQIRGITGFLVERIRGIGVEVPDDIIPPDNMAIRWSDIALFEVNEEHRSEVYLIPDAVPVAKNAPLISLAYHARPSEKWMQETLGDGLDFSERDLCDHFFKYDIKCCSLGSAKSDEQNGFLEYMCCLLPSSIGSPVIRNDIEYDHTSNFFPFCAINCGRSRTNIRSAEGPGGVLATRRHNLSIVVRNLAFVLVYQQYVAPKLAHEECHQLVRQFLRPFKILSEGERLAACHVKMLKDADEFNEYGMSFYENNKLKLALHCFREGARMFSIANIPDQKDYDKKLKDALQSNVSSVIMSLKDAGQMM